LGYICVKTNNYFSPQITTHKKTTIYGVGNPVPGLGQVQKVAMLKQVNRMPTNNKNNNNKPRTNPLPLKPTTHYMQNKRVSEILETNTYV
jgi:hypothetical protein